MRDWFRARRRQWRLLLIPVLLGSMVVAVDVGTASADAPDPVLSSTTGSLQVNADKTVTLTVNGTWAWSTHKSDCNFDGRAVGFAVDWHDTAQPGFLVTTVNNVAVKVGATTVANQLNPTDNLVHPTPATEIANPAYGGCGTYANPPGYNSGVWGSLKHTYPAGTTSFKVCVVMYDVHLNSNGGTPKATSETTAGGSGHNGDNSVEKNSSTPLGNGCFNKTFPLLTTQSSPNVVLGGKINDTATLSGGTSPTGTITFDLFSDAACQNKVTTLDATSPVSGNGNYTSTQFQPAQTGTFYWIAHYSGDGNNAPANGKCGDPNESATVAQAVPTITTQSSGTATIGDAISDVATLDNGQSPTGTITFDLFSDNTCQTKVTTVSATTSVNGNGSYPSDPFTPTKVGTYYWIAHYSGDAINAPANGKCGDSNESVSVNKSPTSIATQASANVVLGGSIKDTATLSGGVAPTGTITFDVFRDAACTNKAATLTATSAVNGNGTYTSNPFTPGQAATFYFIAHYSGDANNQPVDGKCGDSNESVVVLPPPFTTVQKLLPNDTATFTDGSTTGTVTFKLYPPSQPYCGGTPAFSQKVNISGGAASTSNNAFIASTGGTWRWLVSYGGDANHPPYTGPCGRENFVITNG